MQGTAPIQEATPIDTDRDGWTISIEYARTTPVPGHLELLAEELLDRLLDHGAVVTVDPDRLRVTLSVDGTRPAVEAIAQATTIVSEAARAVGWPDWPIVHVEAMTYAEQDRLLEEPAFPRLTCVSEIAEMLGVTSQRVSALRHRPDFPAPVAELRSGPIWRLADIQRFVEMWPRKPGRPRTTPGPRPRTSSRA